MMSGSNILPFSESVHLLIFSHLAHQAMKEESIALNSVCINSAHKATKHIMIDMEDTMCILMDVHNIYFIVENRQVQDMLSHHQAH